jgi:4-hydroxy-tetrahydrodipicolinate synthase
MRAHVESIAASTEKPIILYNIPGRTVINVPPEQLADLATIENVRAVKQANNDDLGPIPGLELLAGNDDILLRCLELGGTGGICVASHIVGPRMAQIHNLFKAGDGEAARELNATLEPLFDALTVTTNPIPIKGALQMLGICSERMRLPMVPLDDAQRAVVRDALVQLDLEVVA